MAAYVKSVAEKMRTPSMLSSDAATPEIFGQRSGTFQILRRYSLIARTGLCRFYIPLQ
jgi:hypothetical protein